MCSVLACFMGCSSFLMLYIVPWYRVTLHAPEKAATAKPATAEEESVDSAKTSSTTHCTGANYFKEGEDPVLKPDEEYPKWLWGLLDMKEGEAGKKHEQRRENKRKIREMNFERAQSSR